MRSYPFPIPPLPRSVVPRKLALILALALAGVAPTVQAEDSPTLKWQNSDISIGSSLPVAGPDSTIYIGSNLGGLYAFRPDGTLRWCFSTSTAVQSTPAIGPDGTIYFGDEGGSLYALTPGGSPVWKFRTGAGIYSSPAVGNRGCVYIGCNDGFLYAVRPDGSLRWKYWMANPQTLPVIAADGTIIVAGGDGLIHAITPQGVRKWVYAPTRYNTTAAPAIGADGAVYHGGNDNWFHAINPDGSLRWKRYIQGAGYSSPAVAADGTIYLGTLSGDQSYILALNPDGSEKWKFRTEENVTSSPAIGHDGTVYIGCNDGNLYAFTPAGNIRWKYPIQSGTISCPLLFPDGSLYFAATGLLALQTDNRGYQPGSPWPAITFTPARSLLTSDVPEPELHTVYGQVAMPDSTPIVDCGVLAGELATRTDDFGFYSFQLPDGEYTITFQVNSTVIPDSVTVNVRGADVFVNLYPLAEHLVQGRLRNKKGPLAGMSILVGSETAVTDRRGYFSFRLPDGDYLLQFDAGEEYFPSARGIRVNGTDLTLGDIFLNHILWEYPMNGFIRYAPMIGRDETVYLLSDREDPSSIFALYPNGKLRGKNTIGSNRISFPIQGPDGTLYVASWDNLIAFDPDLNKKWSFPVSESGASSTPALGSDGTIFFGCFYRAYALNPDGTIKWRFRINERINTSPIIAEDGRVYFICENRYVYAFNQNGTLYKKYEDSNIPELNTAPPPVTYSCRDGVLCAIKADGTVQWEFPGIDDWTYGWAYPPTGEIWTWQAGYPLGLNPDGTLKWRHRAPWTNPAYGPHGRIYAAYVVSVFPYTTHIYAIDMVDPDNIVVSAASPEEESARASDVPRTVLRLRPNYPNPFNPETIIEFSLSAAEPVTVEVFNASGQLVERLKDTRLPAGVHRVTWNGAAHASGVYLARVRAGNAVATVKMLMTK